MDVREENQYSYVGTGTGTGEDKRLPLSQDAWVITLFRRNDQNTIHAFLLLEGLDNHNRHFVLDAHLAIKQDNNGDTLRDAQSNRPFATIITRNSMAPQGSPDYLDPEKIKHLAENCSGKMYTITKRQGQAFNALVLAEKEFCDANLRFYLNAGNTTATGAVGKPMNFFSGGASHQRSQVSVQDCKEKIEEKLGNRTSKYGALVAGPLHSTLVLSIIVEGLVSVDGHNCLSWAEAMLKAIQIPYSHDTLLSSILVYPPSEIKGITHHEMSLPQPPGQ